MAGQWKESRFSFALVNSALHFIAFPQGRSSLVFNACSRFGPLETCTVIGTQGTMRASGPVCGITAVDLLTADGAARADLAGSWFPDGFRDAMSELLCAIEENREPKNPAAENLRSLALCFAAMKVADEGRAVVS